MAIPMKMTNMCEFKRVLDSGDTEVVGWVFLMDGAVQSKPSPGSNIEDNTNAMQSVMEWEAQVTVNGETRRVSKTSDPARWFRALPLEFGGTYFFAGFV